MIRAQLNRVTVKNYARIHKLTFSPSAVRHVVACTEHGARRAQTSALHLRWTGQERTSADQPQRSGVHVKSTLLDEMSAVQSSITSHHVIQFAFLV